MFKSVKCGECLIQSFLYSATIGTMFTFRRLIKRWAVKIIIMIYKIDTERKVITIEQETNLHEIVKSLKQLLGKDYKDYSIVSQNNYYPI